MIPAHAQASAFVTGRMANAPIRFRSLTMWMRGMTAKESCMERSTWLKTSNSPVAPSPAITIVTTAGMMAMIRVTRRRSHGRSRMFTNPSITIWPASVPVIVELWPEQMRATAKRTGAAPLPTRGARSWWAPWIDATSVCPDR